MDFLDVINYAFIAILIGVAGTWILLIKSMVLISKGSAMTTLRVSVLSLRS